MSFDRALLEIRQQCPLCRGEAFREHLVLDGFHIVRCADCSFLFVREVIPDEVAARYYGEGYAGLRHQQGQQVNASINVEVLRSIGDVAGKALLDIGSGFGFLLARARDELGMTVTGAELSKSERNFSADRLRVETFAGIDRLPAGRRFDVISLFEVVEHLRDPVEFVAGVLPLLNPGGFLVLGTDNFESRAVKTMGSGFPKWIPHQHISLFGPATLRRLVAAAGALRIISEASYTPWEYGARILVQKLSGGRFGVRNFQLDDELGSEEDRGYAFFPLRRATNRLYVRMSQSRTLDGSMMQLVAQKV